MADWLGYLLRFLAGGLLVASVPLIARRVSPIAAGIIVLVPIITLLSFYFIGHDLGMDAVRKASLAAMATVPTILAFLLGVYVISRFTNNVLLSLATGVGAWLVAVVPLAIFYPQK